MIDWRGFAGAAAVALVLASGACSSTSSSPDAGGTGSSSAGAASGGDSSTGAAASSSGGSSSGGATSGGSSTGAAGTSTGGASTGGPTCAGPDAGCAPLGCCPGLSCDAATSRCVLPCGVSDDGGACVSLADCLSPLVCAPAGEGGVCQPPGPAPSLACSATGENCGGSLPACCGGPCVGINCVARSACALQGASCTRDSDCCLGLSCAGDGGTHACAPSCGGALAPCQTSADCCRAKGLSCVGSGASAFCYTEDPAQPYDADAGRFLECGGPCSGYQCTLGTGCAPYVDGGAVIDPCAAAGLVCDATGAVCRQPGEFESCAPGGPPCQALPDSTVENLQCMTLPVNSGGTINLCVQPCRSTSDCVDDLTACLSLGTLGSLCYYNFCTSYFAPCNARGTDDGLCLPLQAGGTTYGFCEQAAITGGHAGSACDALANRQIGGQCDTSDVCVDDLCLPACNAGLSGGPSCAGGDGGSACLAVFGESGSADDPGACGRACGFLADGGGCLTDGGLPEKCVPQYLLGLGDVFEGVCVLGPDAGLPVGAPCLSLAADADPCVEGALCLDTGAAGAFCAALCDPTTASGCAAGQLCLGFASQGYASQTSGYCEGFLSDGGVWF